MKILAIDTSTDYLTLAVMDGEKILGKFHKKVDRNHSSLLVPMIEKLVKKCGLKLKDMDGFCVGVGPGSFTGLRIGVVTIKGLGYALNKPIVTVPTFDAIAYNVKKFSGTICVVFDARKSKVYAALYKTSGNLPKRISKYMLLPAKELLEKLEKYDKVFFIGDAVGLLGKTADESIDWHPKAEIIARLGLESFRKRKFVKAEKLEPLYLYSKECDITGK